ncbi:MAG: AAA family ATPase [Candidatus Firestonebacteria bacterium]|nr:AAA family ATPase [Candidatus Firestonebacteria bacterium]
MIFDEAFIFGFGKLENFRVNFSSKLTIIHGNNEAGKTTFQTFLWAMLYGLVNPEARTRIKMPEFDKYIPWNEKISYGGVLRYTLISGQKIEIHRKFEPHDIKIIDSICGTDLTPNFPLMKNREPLFAMDHLGLSLREFLNTVFIRQLKIHELEDHDQSLISARLISLAETGDEELSVKKAIERLDKTISLNIGVEDTRSVKPLRIAIDKKEELNNKLKIAKENHKQILEIIMHLRNNTCKLQNIKNERETIKIELLSVRKRELKEKISKIYLLIQSLNIKEPQFNDLSCYESFPQDEWKNVIELNSSNSEFQSDVEILKEKVESSIKRKELYESKFKNYPLNEQINKDMEKLTAIDTDRDMLNYNILKEQGFLSTIKQELASLKNSIQEFKERSGELNGNLIEKIHEKDLLEANLKLQKNELDKITENIKVNEYNKSKQENIIKNKKIMGIILCLTLIGVIFAIPIFINIKKLRKELEILVKGISGSKEKLESLYKKFDADNELYQNLHKMQLSLQNRMNVTNLSELKLKYNEFIKLEEKNARAEEKMRDSESRILEYRNRTNQLNEQARVIIERWGVSDIKSCRKKYEEYMKLYEQWDKYKKEIEIISRTIKDREIKINDLQKKTNVIYFKAKVKTYDEFLESYKKAQKSAKLKEEIKDLKEKILILTEGKQIEDIEKEISEIEEGINIKEEIRYRDNTSIEELALKEKKLAQEIQTLENEIIKMETQLKYMGQDINTVSELESELDEIEQTIKYLQTEKCALLTARKNIEELTQVYHRTRFVPELKKIVTPWLKSITNKYEEILVDEKLKIKVRIPDTNKLVDISHLSIGTQEQIYFIFKTAIGRMLTKCGEKVPVVLDDIFVNFDYDRRNKVWETIFMLSQENQIILLTCHKEYVNELKSLFEHNNIQYSEEFITPDFGVIKEL